MLDRFTLYELRKLELAESIVPFGEYAATLRAKYQSCVMAAAQGNTQAAQDAERIWKILAGA